MDNIHQVVLSNFSTIANNVWTSIMIDINKPKEASRCFLCVDKFVGFYKVPVGTTEDNINIYCDAIQNSYRYNGNGNDSTAVRSNFLDSFLTTTITGTDPDFFAVYNANNKHEIWLEIPIERLNNLRFSFNSGTNLATGSLFNLHLKFKFA